MIFAARQMSYSRLDSSPVASGWSRSCSMMNRSIVMTSDPCTMAVRGESDRAALTGPENRDAVPRQPPQHLGRWMAVMIAAPHADHRLVRPQLGEPRVRRRAPRAVMAHLEQLHRPHRPREPPLDWEPRVGLEQQPHRAERHLQHHAVLVHVERQRQPRSEEHTSELQSHSDLVCRLLLEKKKKKIRQASQQQTQK